MKINGSYLSIIIGMAVLSMLAVSPAFADVIGSISFTDGRVDILTAGQSRALPVESGAPISAGDIIRTKSGARAEISLTNGTALRLAEKTRVGTTNANSLNLMRGRLRTTNPVAGFEVNTANGKAAMTGTDFYTLHEKGSTWFYGTAGTLQASSKANPNNPLFIDARSCVRIAAGIPMLGSCVYQDVDVDKYAWDTSTTEKTPVVAKLPTEGGVFTYTPLGGRAVDTPSMPVTIQNQDLVCTQCVPEIRIVQGTLPDPIPTPTPKLRGEWERLDPCGACPTVPGDGDLR